jgi:hypothetical protein
MLGMQKYQALPHKLQSPRRPGTRDLCTSVVQNVYGKKYGYMNAHIYGPPQSLIIHLETVAGMLMLSVSMAVD